MKVFLGVVLCAMVMVSCTEDSDITPDSETFELFNNSAIVSVQTGDIEYYKVEAGEGSVAVYRFNASQSNDIYDDEFVESMTFELPEDRNTFSLKDEELVELRAFYRQEGAWPANLPNAVIKGTISGTRNVIAGTDRWEVSIDIEMQNDGVAYATIKTSGILVLQ